MLPLVIIAVLIVAGYLVSLRVHPYSRCRACKGGGRHWGSVYKYAQRPCRSCGGSGRHDRLGARILRIGQDR